MQPLRTKNQLWRPGLSLKKLNTRRPNARGFLRRLRGHIDELLSERQIRELEQDRDFQLSKNRADGIEGWVAGVEGALLYFLAKKSNLSGVIVEIGSWKGRSTVFLANGSKAGHRAKVYAVDPHEGNGGDQRVVPLPTFCEFKKNIASAQAEDIVVPIVKTSKDAANAFRESCALIFVDGSHEPDSVKQDFALWYPKLEEGGIIAFHDTLDYVGRRMVVKDLLYKSDNFKNVRFARSITYGEKVIRNTLADRLKNRYFLILNDIYKFLLQIGRVISKPG